MIAASFLQFTGWMAVLAIGVAAIAWAGVYRERRRAERMFEAIHRARNDPPRRGAR